MPGPFVTIGCAVTLAPGAAGPPDSGVLVSVPQGAALVGGLPLATTGSMVQLVNSVSGAPYTLPVGSAGGSGSVDVDGQALLRVGDQIPTGPGVLTIIGPPAAPFLTDQRAP